MRVLVLDAAGAGGPVRAAAEDRRPGPGGQQAGARRMIAVRVGDHDGLDPLGAEFERREDAGGVAIVKAITPRGFAEASGLEVGDIVEKFAIAGTMKTVDEYLAEYPSTPPNTWIEWLVRRRKADAPPGAADADADATRRLEIGTSKRDGPALSLFVGRDRQ